MKKILICLPTDNEKYAPKMNKAAQGHEIRHVLPANLTQEDVDWAQIIIGNIPVKFLHGQEIEFMQLTSAGADAYVKEGVLNRNTVLSCSTGAYSQTVAEHAIAVTLMLLKNLHLYRDDQNEAFWTDEGTTRTIDGATVLVMGMGDIGRYYARMAKALGAYVIGCKRTAGDKPEYVDELYTTDKFDEVVPRADIVFSILPGTAATEYFYTLDRFKLMKNSAIFINCGRGNAVSADVLYEVLTGGIIEAAGVDVFEQEPLPADSKLWGLKNLVITPHASGFFHLPATIGRVTDICAYNLEAFLNNKDIRNVVDYETGYKK